MSSDLYPVYLDLSGREVLVVGGGPVAARKVGSLLRAGAAVTVVAPEPCRQVARLAEEQEFALEQRRYHSEDIEGKWLVIAATGDEAVNERVADDADGARVFCNVVDAPEMCSFQVPAVVRRGLLQLAISTGGASPALARRLRRRLEEQFGSPYEDLLEGLLELRRHVQEEYPDRAERRRQVLEGFLDSPAPARLLEDGDRAAFREMLEQWKRA